MKKLMKVVGAVIDVEEKAYQNAIPFYQKQNTATKTLAAVHTLLYYIK